jgi:hypothetical protein
VDGDHVAGAIRRQQPDALALGHATVAQCLDGRVNAPIKLCERPKDAVRNESHAPRGAGCPLPQPVWNEAISHHLSAITEVELQNR